MNPVRIKFFSKSLSIKKNETEIKNNILFFIHIKWLVSNRSISPSDNLHRFLNKIFKFYTYV